MNRNLNKKIAFAGKSALWAAILYVVMMCAINWDDISGIVNGRNPVSVVNPVTDPSLAPVFSQTVSATEENNHKNIGRDILSVLRLLAGITSHSHS